MDAGFLLEVTLLVAPYISFSCASKALGTLTRVANLHFTLFICSDLQDALRTLAEYS